MKQVVQDFRTGEVRLAVVDPPASRRGFVRVETAASVVSPGTERAILLLARKSLMGKARARPDLVRRVWKKMRRDGLSAAVRTVKDRLDAPVPLGYSAAGRVSAAPAGSGFVRGDAVACAGAGWAVHAEEIVVPKNLVARVPAGVPLQDAAFATLGAVSLNAVRATGASLGERVAVLGAGLLGTLAIRMLRAAGVRVAAVDPDPARCERARADGAEVAGPPDGAGARVRAWTGGAGVDAVVIAAASADDGPVSTAADVLRKAGVVVALGDVPLKLPRRLYYAKEAVLRVATSYGPGRYDRSYEENGRDYPLAYVRWTAGRNLEAFLSLLASGAVRVSDLAEAVPIDDAPAAYERLVAGGGGAKATVFVYPEGPRERRAPPAEPTGATPRAPGLRTALVGTGAFARGVLWRELAKAGLVPQSAVASTGASAAESARKLGFPRHGTDAFAAVADPDVDVVVVATPHHLHAALAAAALAAGKHVFVEKPLAIDAPGLDAVEEAVSRATGTLTVGFNRRFSPAALAAREFLAEAEGPSVVTYRVNAGEAPEGSWVADPGASGGRIVGEACHMVDLAGFLVGERPARVAASASRGEGPPRDDTGLLVAFDGGSTAAITYHSVGDAALGKERLEVARGDRVVVVEDFREVTFVAGGKTTRRRFGPDKGHAAEARAFVKSLKEGGPPPIPYADLFAVTRATLRARDAIASARFEDV